MGWEQLWSRFKRSTFHATPLHLCQIYTIPPNQDCFNRKDLLKIFFALIWALPSGSSSRSSQLIEKTAELPPSKTFHWSHPSIWYQLKFSDICQGFMHSINFLKFSRFKLHSKSFLLVNQIFWVAGLNPDHSQFCRTSFVQSRLSSSAQSLTQFRRWLLMTERPWRT